MNELAFCIAAQMHFSCMADLTNNDKLRHDIALDNVPKHQAFFKASLDLASTKTYLIWQFSIEGALMLGQLLEDVLLS